MSIVPKVKLIFVAALGNQFLFRILSGFAVMIISFSVKHRSFRNVVVGSCTADYSPFNVEVLIIVP